MQAMSNRLCCFGQSVTGNGTGKFFCIQPLEAPCFVAKCAAQGNTALQVALLRQKDACALAMLKAKAAHRTDLNLDLTNDKVNLVS